MRSSNWSNRLPALARYHYYHCIITIHNNVEKRARKLLPSYYNWNHFSLIIIAVNPCTNGNEQCEQICNYVEPGQYTCACNQGYVLNGQYACDGKKILFCNVQNRKLLLSVIKINARQPNDAMDRIEAPGELLRYRLCNALRV